MLTGTSPTNSESFIPFGRSRCNCGTFSKELPMFADLNLKYISKEINLQLQDLKTRGSELETYDKCS